MFLFFRAFTWSTTPSSFLRPMPQPSSSWVLWATTSSAQPTTRKIFSVAPRVTAKSGVRSPPSSSVPTDRLMAAFTRANWWPQGFGEWLVTWTTRAIWWAHWRIAWPVVASTCCPIFTSSTWPSYWCTAAFVTSTAVAASTARTGSATLRLCPTVCCLTSSSAFRHIPDCFSATYRKALCLVIFCGSLYLFLNSWLFNLLWDCGWKVLQILFCLLVSEWVSVSVHILYEYISSRLSRWHNALHYRILWSTQVLMLLSLNKLQLFKLIIVLDVNRQKSISPEMLGLLLLISIHSFSTNQTTEIKVFHFVFGFSPGENLYY